MWYYGKPIIFFLIMLHIHTCHSSFIIEGVKSSNKRRPHCDSTPLPWRATPGLDVAADSPPLLTEPCREAAEAISCRPTSPDPLPADSQCGSILPVPPPPSALLD
jgi:hypothetical protein